MVTMRPPRGRAHVTRAPPGPGRGRRAPPKLVRRACPRRPPRSRARPGECGGGRSSRSTPWPTSSPSRFAAAGHRLYLVGGSVRDALLGREACEQTDLDFTTDARPAAVLAVLEGWAEAVWDTGIAFGTVGARRHGTTVEITTFRADAYDRVSRNPVVAFGDTIDDDLVRRDFTVNAMAVELTGGEQAASGFVDPHGGLAALAAGMLDTPATPEESFADDPLRMLRAARFVSQLGLDARAAGGRGDDGDGRRAGAHHRRSGCRSSCASSSSAAHPRRGIELLVDTGLAEYVLPEVPAMRLAIDEHMQHKDVYTHSLVVLEQAIDRETAGPGPRAAARRAAARHRQARAPGATSPTGGSASTTTRSSARSSRASGCATLRYSKAVIDEVTQLVFLHLRFHGYGTGEWTDSAVRRYVTRRRAAAGPAAQAGPLRLHHPQPAAGGGAAAQLRLARAAHRGAARAGGARRDPPRPRRQRDHGAARRPAGPARGEGLQVHARRCGWSAARSVRRRRRPSSGGGRRRTASRATRTRSRTTADLVP